MLHAADTAPWSTALSTAAALGNSDSWPGKKQREDCDRINYSASLHWQDSWSVCMANKSANIMYDFSWR